MTYQQLPHFYFRNAQFEKHLSDHFEDINKQKLLIEFQILGCCLKVKFKIIYLSFRMFSHSGGKLYGEEQPALQSDWVKQKLERGK